MYDALTGNLDFSEALKSLRNGNRVARRSWYPDVYLFVDEGKLFMSNKTNFYHWFVGPTDLMAEDWYELV